MLYKNKLRSYSRKEGGEDAHVDLSYFGQRRAGIIKTIARHIPKERKDLRMNEFEHEIQESGTSIADIEREFDCQVDVIIDLAYDVDPPNRISMMIHFEHIRKQIGKVPTRTEFENLADFGTSTYDGEFRSWENMLGILGYTTPQSQNSTDKMYSTEQQQAASLEHINLQIARALFLIQSTPGGVYVDRLEKLLGIAIEELPALMTRLVRIEGIVKKTIQYDGVDMIILQYEKPHQVPLDRWQSRLDAA